MACFIFFTMTPVHAANGTWNAASGEWTTGTNWSGGLAPGTAGTGKTDTSIATIAGGGAGNPFSITDSALNRNLTQIAFTNNATLGNYTIGSSANTLHFTNNGIAGNIVVNGSTGTGSSQTIASNLMATTATARDANDLRVSTADGFNGTLTLTGTVSSTATSGISGFRVITSAVSTGGNANNRVVLAGNMIDGAGTNKLGFSRGRDGVVLITGTNTYSGGTQIGADAADSLMSITQIGVDSVGTAAAISSGAFGTGELVLSAGTISSDGTTARTILNTFRTSTGGTMGLGNATNNGTLTFAGSGIIGGNTFSVASSVVMSGVLSGTGTTTKSGAGTLTLSAANTFSGSFAVTGGSLNLSNSLALQSATLSSSGSTIVFDSSVASHAFTLGGLSGNGSLALTDNGANAVALNVGGGNGSTSYGGVMSGGGSLTKAGTGTLTLSGTNTYTGTTTISAGTLQIGSAGTTGALSTSSAIVNNGGLAFNRTNAMSQGTDFSGAAISGSGSLTQAGTGVLTLTAANTYTGTTTISAGTLRIGNGGTTGSLSTGSAIINNANLTFERSNAVVQGTDFSGAAITGTGSLTKAGTGNLTLNAANTYAGLTSITGGVLIVSHNNALGTTAGQTSVNGGTVQLAPDIIVTGETITVAGAGGDSNGALQAGSGNSEWAGAVILGAGARLGATTGNLTVSGAISGAQNLNIGTGNGFLGVGSVTLSAASGQNTYTGITAIVRGTLKLGADDTLPAGTILDVDSTTAAENAVFDLNGFNQTVAGLQRSGQGSGAGSSTVTNSAAGSVKTLTLNQSTNTSFGGVITGNLAITKSGAGTLILNNTNSFTGGTTVSGGVLQLNSAGGSGAGSVRGTITISAGGTVNASAVNAFGYLAGSRVETVNINGGLLQTTAAGDQGWDVEYNLTGGTMRSNGGTSSATAASYFILGRDAAGSTGVNSFASATTSVVEGRLQLRGNNGITNINFTAEDGAAVTDLLVSAAITQSAGTLGITKGGAGNMTLSGANSYGGVTSVSQGTLQFAKQVSLYNGATSSWTAANINVASGATLALNVGGTGEFTSGNVDTIKSLGTGTGGFLNGSRLGLDTTNATGGSFAYSSVIGNTNNGANSIGLTKLGTGILELSGNNTYTGSTLVSAGTLLVNGNQSAASGAVTVTSGATLGGTGTIGGSTIINGIHAVGGTANGGIGSQTFSGDLAYSAGSTFSWQLGSETTTGRGTNFDAVTIGGALSIDGGSVFKIVVTDLNLDSSFWASNKTWDVFDGSSTTGGFGSFQLYSTADLVNSIDYRSYGSFSFNSGNGSLQWSVPEPTNALAGLLIAAGLLRRSRRRMGD